MSTTLTGPVEAPHIIEVGVPPSRWRINATRLAATAARAVFVAVALAVTMAGFVLGAPRAGADNTVAINNKVKHSVVQVWVTWTGWVEIPGQYMDNRQPKWVKTVAESSCSGFVVDSSGFIATAGHCVDNTSEDTKAMIRAQMVSDEVKRGNLDAADQEKFLQLADNQEWLVEGSDRGSPIERKVEVMQPDDADRVIDRWTTVQVVQYQGARQGDNALLKVMESKPLQPLVVADKVPASGEALTVVGFPGNVSDVVDKGRLAQPSFTSGTVSGQQVLDNGVPVTEVNANFVPGMSGGAAIDTDGDVVGVVSQGFGTRGNNFITNAAALRTFLAQNGVHLAERPAPAKSFPWMWVIIGAVATLLPAVAAPIALRLRAKRRRTSVQAQDATGQPAPAQQQSPTGTVESLPEQRSDVLVTTPAATPSPTPQEITPAGNGAAPTG
jgi:serine protease Do